MRRKAYRKPLEEPKTKPAEVAATPPAPPPEPFLTPKPEPPKPKSKIPYKERLRREAQIDILLTQGKGTNAIIEFARTQFHGQSKYLTLKMIQRVKDQWAADATADRVTMRQAAVRRIHRYLDELQREPVKMRNALTARAKALYEEDAMKELMAGKEARPPYDPARDTSLQVRLAELKSNWKAIRELEDLLADLQGTKEAVKIDINVTMQENLVHVISGMSEEQMTEAYEKVARALDVQRQVIDMGIVLPVSEPPQLPKAG